MSEVDIGYVGSKLRTLASSELSNVVNVPEDDLSLRIDFVNVTLHLSLVVDVPHPVFNLGNLHRLDPILATHDADHLEALDLVH